MSTQHGSIWAHHVDWRWVESGSGSYAYFVTIHFAQPRTITADTALTLVSPHIIGAGRAAAFWSECGISEPAQTRIRSIPRCRALEGPILIGSHFERLL